MPDGLVVYDVSEDAPAKAEAMGTKPKFWFSREGTMWLFKATRPGQGEHWAEVVAAGLADMLGLPHAHYDLARWRDSTGVVTPRFTPQGFDLVHGNELLAERDPNYPLEGARYVRTQEHTVDAVRAVIGDLRVGLPIDWTPPPGIESAVDVFGGYLLLDAWIGNTDRHHENWGLVVNIGRDERNLAPTFDHASSLGAHETDDQRSKRLDSRDSGFRVEAYVQRPRVRSALYGAAGDARPLGLIEALVAWAKHARCDAWLHRLASIRENVRTCQGLRPGNTDGQQEAYPRDTMRTLYLAWRQPDRRWWPVGRLDRENSEYVFTYTKGAVSAAQAGFHPLLSFPDLGEVYASRDLFPLFGNRLPPRSRPDYEDFVQWLDLGPAETNPMVLLARSGGRRETDMFEVFPVPEPSNGGRYESAFFVHGLRHRGAEAEEEARRLQRGDPVALEPEPANPEDPRALRVRTLVRGVHLGFVPRYLCDDIHSLRAACGNDVQTRVRRVNLPPTPAQFRVLCSLEAPWPEGFRPLQNPDFEPLHALAPAAHR